MHDRYGLGLLVGELEITRAKTSTPVQITHYSWCRGPVFVPWEIARSITVIFVVFWGGADCNGAIDLIRRGLLDES